MSTDDHQRPEDALTLSDIAFNLATLVEELSTTAKRIVTRELSHAIEDDLRADGADMSTYSPPLSEKDRESHRRAEVQNLLTALGKYRRGYNRWERLLTEHALSSEHLTQREVAARLGIGLSTVNRWAQHPLPRDGQ